jgi:hypothetical protein
MLQATDEETEEPEKRTAAGASYTTNIWQNGDKTTESKGKKKKKKKGKEKTE